MRVGKMGVRMGKKSRKGVRKGRVKMGKGIGSVKGEEKWREGRIKGEGRRIC